MVNPNNLEIGYYIYSALWHDTMASKLNVTKVLDVQWKLHGKHKQSPSNFRVPPVYGSGPKSEMLLAVHTSFVASCIRPALHEKVEAFKIWSYLTRNIDSGNEGMTFWHGHMEANWFPILVQPNYSISLGNVRCRLLCIRIWMYLIRIRILRE